MRSESGGDEPLVDRVIDALRRWNLLDARIGLGFSGGMDSTVLLDLLVQASGRCPMRLAAVHVDHRISDNAARWAEFCRAACARYGVPCAVVQVDVPRRSGESLEAAARAARYAAFRKQDVDAVALAHHLDDQAETLLLQLLRGAGPQGLAGMPPARPLTEGAGAQLVRPLLETPRRQLADYARRHRLEWVEDESNAMLDFDRNYLRHEVLPRIGARFAAYRETWLRASRNFADLTEIADAMAQMDAVQALQGEGLRIEQLREIGTARAGNLLRWFLARHSVPVPGRALLREALRQLLAPAPAQPVVDLGSALLRRHRGVMRIVARATQTRSWKLAWQGEPELVLPGDLGVLRFEAVTGAGLSADRLGGAAVSVRPRAGGERLRLAPNRPTHTLKHLLQEAGVPPWVRERLPVLYCGDVPAWAAGVGLDCRFAAEPGEAGVLPHWIQAPRTSC